MMPAPQPVRITRTADSAKINMDREGTRSKAPDSWTCWLVEYLGSAAAQSGAAHHVKAAIADAGLPRPRVAASRTHDAGRRCAGNNYRAWPM
jgi:hypothetical protein